MKALKKSATIITASIVLLLISLASPSAWAQNLDELGVKKGVKVNGSVNLSTVAYAASGIENRRDPFNWFFTGNLNLNLFGYNAPFSFSYSNAGAKYSQPFNQFNFAPQYKWVKTYVGNTSMTFSPYTLAGHQFYGGGVELTPGKWRFAAMYGRLRKEVLFNPLDSTYDANASFRRMGYGIKAGYDDGGNSLMVSLFGAKDEVNSLPFLLPNTELTPKQNVATSIGGRKKITERIFVEGEYALSILNKDIRAEVSDSAGSYFLKGLLPTNATTRHFDAYHASAGYQGNGYGLAVKYERVAPEYETMGAYYFNNDMRNITLVPSLQLFKSRLTLSGNVGIQRNNLDNTRTATTRRFVGAATAGYNPNDRWSFSGGYSNFSTYTRMRPPTDPFFRNGLDSLNFYQLTQAINGMSSFLFGSKERKQSLMLSASFQRANDQATHADLSQLADFYSGSLSYSYSLTPQQATLAASMNYNGSKAPQANSTFWGPNLSVSKGFLNKTLRSSLSGSYNSATTNGLKGNDVINSRLSLTYTPATATEKKSMGKHNLSLGVNWLKKLNGPDNQIPTTTLGYSEWTVNGNYTFSF